MMKVDYAGSGCDERPYVSAQGATHLFVRWMLMVPLPIMLLIWLFSANR